MSKTNNTLLYAGIGLGAIYLLSNKGASSALIPTGSNVALLNQGTPAAIGVNSGVRGGNGSFYTCANWQQLAAQYPNLTNPNYQMSAAENSQYLANYLDLQQAMPSWVGVKQVNGITPQNVNQAAQLHWQFYGCAEKRIFLPLQPPSNGAYIPPPANNKSSGSSSVLSAALGVVGTAAPYLLALLGPGQPDPKLSDADLQLLFTGGAILKDILPMFSTNDPLLTKKIDQHFTAALTPYTV